MSGKPPVPRTAREMVDMARGFLERKGVEGARLEAELLVSHALGLERLGLFMRLDQPLQAGEVDLARDLLVRRGRREPVAYVIGAKEFFGRRFEVGSGVLVPRPETELIIDRARELWGKRLECMEGETPSPRIADIGTGSGCIAITLALEIEGAEVTGVDVSSAALVWAQRNNVALDGGVTLVEADGLAWLDRAESSQAFDLLISNPPYVEPGESLELAPEVREHEPLEALFAPHKDPDFWARELCARAPRVLAPQGTLLVELGHLQAQRVLEIAATAGLVAQIIDDLSGIPRLLEARAADPA